MTAPDATSRAFFSLCAMFACIALAPCFNPAAHSQNFVDSSTSGSPTDSATGAALGLGRARNSLVWPARICLAESDLRLADCAAELHVARKRAPLIGTDWIGAARAYSSLERSRSPRAARIRRLPWEALPETLRALVTAFARGEVPDPCERATHWGSPTDHPRGRMVRVRCTERMANRFYAVKS